MPKLLYLTLSLTTTELQEYKQQLESNINYDLLYPSPDKICKIEPIKSEDEITSLYISNDRDSKHNTVNNNIIIFKNKVNLSLNDCGIIEKNNIYIFKDQFNLNNISNDFLNQFKDYNPNSLCWWCCYPLEIGTVPIPLPIKYNDIKKTFKCKGLFCSFNCSLAYCFRFKEGCSMLINFLHKKMTGVLMKNHPIKPAPPREILDNFGGIVNIKKFRTLVESKTVYDIVEYPVIFTTSELREKSLQIVFKQDSKAQLNNLDDSTFDKNGNELQLETKENKTKNKVKTQKTYKSIGSKIKNVSIRSMLNVDSN